MWKKIWVSLVKDPFKQLFINLVSEEQTNFNNKLETRNTYTQQELVTYFLDLIINRLKTVS